MNTYDIIYITSLREQNEYYQNIYKGDKEDDQV